MCCGCWLQAGGGGFHKWPPSSILTGRVIQFYTVTQGKVHRAPQLFPFGGVSPWKHQQKLNIWSSPCSARNEHQIKHCTRMQRCRAKQSTKDVRRMTHSRCWLSVNCCLCWGWKTQLRSTVCSQFPTVIILTCRIYLWVKTCKNMFLVFFYVVLSQVHAKYIYYIHIYNCV